MTKFEISPEQVEDIVQAAALRKVAENDNAPKYRVLTDEIWEPLPAIEYLFGGLLGIGKLALIVAHGASCKSWIGIEGIIAVSTGQRFLTRFDVQRQGNARFVDYEMGDHEARRRFQAIARAKGLSTPVEGASLVSMPNVYLNESTFETDLTKLCEGQTFLVIDSLAAGTHDLNENDSSFARPLQAMKRVCEMTGCSILVVHHARKGLPDVKGDPRESVRGSSAIFAAADTVIALTAEDASLKVFRAATIKQRCGKMAEPFLVSLVDLPGEGNVQVVGVDEKPAKEPAETLPPELQIERALADGPLTTNELCKRLKRGYATINKAILNLIHAGDRIRPINVMRRGTEVKAFASALTPVEPPSEDLETRVTGDCR